MRISIIIFFLLLAQLSYTQDFSGYCGNREMKFFVSKQKLIIKFKSEDSIGKDSIARALDSNLLEKSGLNLIYVLNYNELNKANALKKISNWNKHEHLDFATPLLEDASGKIVAGITNTFIVGLKNENDFEVLRKFCHSNDFEITSKSKYDSKTYFLTIKKGASMNAIEAAKFSLDTKLFRYSEPDYLIYLPWGTDDPAFGSQYALTSMNVVNAWSVTTGCSSIKVAVLDNGVELNHPDLAGNILPGYDATGGGNGGASTGTGFSDAHGTNCAGIVGAVANNQKGIAGIAYGCRIVPVKIGSGSFLPFSSMADGINWVRANNAADVITLSGGSLGVSSQIVTDAINAAATTGRNNLGIPFFSITANDGTGTIAFPASLENVIAVGSIDSNNNRASTSNFGTGIDVVAPGVCIYTTDLTGAAGQTSTDYWSCFSGTSAAAPNAAGVMALILSVNPTLTLAQARFILESTTDKISAYTFSAGVSGQPNGTWNNEVGYGKVNALKAVSLAGSILSSSNPICSTSTFSLQYPQGATWSSSNPAGLNFPNPNVGQANRVNNFNGQVTVSATINGGCGNVNISKSVVVGTEYNAVDINSVTVGCVNNRAVASLIFSRVFSTATKIDYYAKDLTNASNPYLLKNTNTSPNGGSGGDLSLGAKNRWYDIRMVVTTPCGTLEAYYEIYAACSGVGGVLRVFPNPSSTQLTLDFESESDLSAQEQAAQSVIADFDAQLYFPFGNLASTGKSKNSKITLDVSNLPDGLYVLKVNKSGEVITKQVLIKH